MWGKSGRRRGSRSSCRSCRRRSCYCRCDSRRCCRSSGSRRRRCWRSCRRRRRRSSATRRHSHVIDVLFVSADRVRVDVESRGICNVASGIVRHNRDVIAYLFVLRKTCLRIERIAHCNVRRPCYATISAEGIKQLRVDVVRSIARVVPHHINTAIRRYRKCAKIVPLALVVGIIIDANRCAKGYSAVCAPLRTSPPWCSDHSAPRWPACKCYCLSPSRNGPPR